MEALPINLHYRFHSPREQIPFATRGGRGRERFCGIKGNELLPRYETSPLQEADVCRAVAGKKEHNQATLLEF